MQVLGLSALARVAGIPLLVAAAIGLVPLASGQEQEGEIVAPPPP